MTSLHNATVHVQAMCGLNDIVLLPILHAVECSEKRGQLELAEIQKLNVELKKELQKLENETASSECIKV